MISIGLSPKLGKLRYFIKVGTGPGNGPISGPPLPPPYLPPSHTHRVTKTWGYDGVSNNILQIYNSSGSIKQIKYQMLVPLLLDGLGRWPSLFDWLGRWPLLDGLGRWPSLFDWLGRWPLLDGLGWWPLLFDWLGRWLLLVSLGWSLWKGHTVPSSIEGSHTECLPSLYSSCSSSILTAQPIRKQILVQVQLLPTAQFYCPTALVRPPFRKSGFYNELKNYGIPPMEPENQQNKS